MLADWNWKQAELNVHNAQFLGAAAHLAYSDEPEVKHTLESWSMELVKFFNSSKDTQAYLARNNDACILAFRGTQPDKVEDWLTDLDALQIPGPVGKVHAGFWNALHDVWPDISNRLKANRESRSLWVTGHSLGGALAVLAAVRLHLEDHQLVNGLYTYGQPRVGDAEFCKGFDQWMGTNTFRFVNYNDIVPRVPFPNMNYGDLGTFQYFNEQQWDSSTTWTQAVLHTVGNTVQELIKNNGVEDHMMDRYLVKLQALANRDIRHGNQ
jgi:triacylglycerol lipase